MAMTIDEISTMLTELGIKHDKKNETTIFTGFGTPTYRAPEGREGIGLVIELFENGEYFSIYAPKAFVAQGPHLDAFLKACLVTQWKTKLIQFEYDSNDGEIRPIIEFPIEDGKLTKKQLERCVKGIVHIMDKMYPSLKKTLDEGVFDFPEDPEQRRIMEAMEELMRLLRGRQGSGGTSTPPATTPPATTPPATTPPGGSTPPTGV